MKKFARKHFMVIAGLFAGATAGYFYWKFSGCSTGSCIITSRPVNTTIYGAVVGGLLFSMFQKDNKLT